MIDDTHYLQSELRDKLRELNESGKLLGTANTFTTQIYVGLYDTENEVTHTKIKVEKTCQRYVEETGLCVNVQETLYQYGSDGKGGMENGAVVELIHYPRFKHGHPEEVITTKALDLAEKLMEELHQKRVSVVTTTDTYTLQNPNHEEVDGNA